MPNTNNPEDGVRVTAICGPEYSIGHNLRENEYVENQKDHIDLNRPHRVYKNMGNEKECYEKIFAESIDEYNKKQTRKDRRITDYLQQILNDERKGKHKSVKANPDRKPFYEFILYLGNRDFHCPDDKAEKILKLFVEKVMPKKFPNYISTHICGHNDEFSFDRKGNRLESPFHIHVTGVYIAHALTKDELQQEYQYRRECKELKKKEIESKNEIWDEELWKKKDWRKGMVERWGKSLEKGMSLQTSMSAACAEMGFYTQKGRGTAQQQFEEAVRYELMDFAESMGVKINRTKGDSHKHKSKDEYVTDKDNEEYRKELEEREKILEVKEIALQNKIDDYDFQIEQIEEKRKQNELDKKNNQKIQEFLNTIKKEQKEKELKINQDLQNIKIREANCNKKEENFEKQFSEKQKHLDEKEQKISQMYKYSIQYKKDADNELKEAAQIYKLNNTNITNFNIENRKKILEIDNWKEASKEIKDTDTWLKSLFTNFQKNQNEHNSIGKLFKKVSEGIKGIIAKVKSSYDEKLKNMNELLHGSKEFFEKDDKILVEYSYGAEDYKDMLFDTPVEDIEKAIVEVKKEGKRTIGEMIKEKGLNFVDKHFSKAKELTHERNIELERRINRKYSYSKT